MKQLTATHHRNYLEVEHKSTGRCTPFAPRHPKEKSKALACTSLDNAVVDPANNNNWQ